MNRMIQCGERDKHRWIACIGSTVSSLCPSYLCLAILPMFHDLIVIKYSVNFDLSTCVSMKVFIVVDVKHQSLCKTTSTSCTPQSASNLLWKKAIAPNIQEWRTQIWRWLYSNLTKHPCVWYCGWFAVVFAEEFLLYVPCLIYYVIENCVDRM